jgi:hypothetical protein
MMLMALFGNQRYVVTEMFTRVGCPTCPAARVALRELVNDIENTEFIIPIIWQGDSQYMSPNYDIRLGAYGIPGIPAVVFTGISQLIGANINITNLRNTYNTWVNAPAPVEISVDVKIDTVSREISVTATLDHITEMYNVSEPRIVFIITYDLLGIHEPDYFASVTHYRHFDLIENVNTYNHTFIYNNDRYVWDFDKANLVVFVQNFDFYREIYNARQDPLSNFVIISDADNTITPKSCRLIGNFPNPFNPTTTVYFELASPSNVMLEIFNIKGQYVKTLKNKHFDNGIHYVEWDGKDYSGRDVTSGIYLYKMQTDSHTEIKKMIMMK